MTKKQKQVQLAKDVIAQLRAKRFTARTGAYAILDKFADAKFSKALETQAEIEMRPIVRASKKCRVCAQGALVVAAIDRFNQCKLGQWDSLNDVAGDYDGELVGRFFSEQQIKNIEAAFEGYAADIWSSNADGTAWKRAYRNHSDRMDAIMRNIIANNGTFDIESIPKPRKNPISKLIAAR